MGHWDNLDIYHCWKGDSGTSSLPAVIERETVRHPSYMLSLQGDIGTPLFFTIFEKGYSWKPLLPAIIERGTVRNPCYLLLLKGVQLVTLVTCYYWKGYSRKPLLPAVFKKGKPLLPAVVKWVPWEVHCSSCINYCRYHSIRYASSLLFKKNKQ